MPMLPRYTKNKMKGNIGEALVQYILSKFCLVHNIDGSNDVGNDFICELIKDEYPTNLLFYVQVKYTQTEPRIKNETLEYWKGSPIPVYIFWIKDIDPGSAKKMDLDLLKHLKESYFVYKRMTPILHGKSTNEEYKMYHPLDFKRDLMIDYARTQYFLGYTPMIQPRAFFNIDEKIQIGLDQYALYISDLIPMYSREILQNGWANLVSLAVTLVGTNQQEDLVSAKLLIGQAERLAEKSETGHVSYFFIRQVKEIIESKLAR